VSRYWGHDAGGKAREENVYKMDNCFLSMVSFVAVGVPIVVLGVGRDRVRRLS